MINNNIFYYKLQTQYENTGDLLINHVLIDQLSQKGQVIIDDYNKPEEFIDSLILNDNVLKSSDLGIDVNLDEYLLAQKSFKHKKSFLVLVPGDIYKEGYKNALRGLKNVFYNFKLKRKGLKLIRLGVSIKELKHFNNLAEILNSLIFHAYYLRDKRSIEKAKKYKLFNIKYIPDLAWGYKFNIKETVKVNPKIKYIILSFRANEHGSHFDSKFLNEIISALDSLLESYKTDKIVIRMTYQVYFDREASIKLYNYFKDKYEVELIDEQLNLEQATDFYSNAEIVFSNRLHVLMLSMLSKTLSIPLINHYSNEKIEGILKDNDLQSTIIYYDDDVVKRNEQFDKIVKNQDSILYKYKEQIRVNADRIEKVLNKIISN